MKSLSSIIDDVKDGIENVGETVTDFIEDTGIDKIFNSNVVRTIASYLVSSKYLVGYSLLKYVVNQAESNNSNNFQGWDLSGNTLKAVGNAVDNLLLINSQNYSEVTAVNASNVVNNLVLVGNALSNAIIGSSGASTLWGGGEGNNTLTGGDSRDQFWYLGGGSDTVTNFVTGIADNSDIAVLVGELKNVIRSGENILINLADGNSLNLQTGSNSSDDVILYSADGENIFGAKIADDSATNLLYSNAANYFQLSQLGSISLNNSENSSLWLDGSQGTLFSNIINIDASNSTGNNTLAGDSNSNQIIAGQGADSLWGGNGEISDTLIGGSGEDTFFFGKNEGDDSIENASADDTINLYDVTLNDITSADVTDNTISIVLNTESNLKIKSANNLSSTFQLADGSKWKFDHNSNAWQNV